MKHLFCLLVVVAAISGCARTEAQGVSRDHWTWSPDASFPAAQVAATEQSGIFFVGCFSSHVSVGFWSGKPADNDALKQPALMLAFDGNAPEPQFGATFNLAGAKIAEDSPGFSDVLRALRSHSTVEAIVVSNGLEERRRRFTLEGAGPAIDKALAACS